MIAYSHFERFTGLHISWSWMVLSESKKMLVIKKGCGAATVYLNDSGLLAAVLPGF